MSDTKFTSGPWSRCYTEGDDRNAPSESMAESPFGVCVARDGFSIAEMWFGTDAGRTISREEAAANADLIAAAPDLYEALERCRETFSRYVDLHMAKQPPDMDKAAANQEILELCEAALARAIGEQP